MTGNAVILMVTPVGHNGLARTDNLPGAIFQGLVNRAIDEKFISVEFQNILLCRIDDVKSSP